MKERKRVPFYETPCIFCVILYLFIFAFLMIILCVCMLLLFLQINMLVSLTYLL